jgi:hypothetical protein
MALILFPGGLGVSGPSFLTDEFWGSDNVIWVDSVTGLDTNAGTRREKPKATVFGAAGAISVCTTNNANVIVCFNTHRETITGAYTWATAGITLCSFGSGTDRATFTSSVAGVAITMTGDHNWIENCYFPASTAATTAHISNTTGGGMVLKDCQFDLGANNANDGVLLNYTTDFPAWIRGCTFKATGAPAGATQIGLRITGASPGGLIEDCTFDGGSVGWTSACMSIDTATADRFRIRHVTLQNFSVAKVAISGVKGTATFNVVDATSRFEWTE